MHGVLRNPDVNKGICVEYVPEAGSARSALFHAGFHGMAWHGMAHALRPKDAMLGDSADPFLFPCSLSPCVAVLAEGRGSLMDCGFISGTVSCISVVCLGGGEGACDLLALQTSAQTVKFRPIGRAS